MLSRINSPFKKRSENSDIRFLQFTRAYNYGENDNDGRDDTSSISSVSTNATMDNNPGTGRIMDKCFYQFLGRKLERLIFRVSVANLSPDRIVQFLWERGFTFRYTHRRPLGIIIQNIREGERIAGLKSLVKQSQSSSMYRSAAALCALLHLTTSWCLYKDFYLAAVESILQLESLANNFDDSHPEKKYFLFLIGIARAHVHFEWYIPVSEITEEFVIICRRRLLEILDSSRSTSHDPLVVIADACLLLADISSGIVKLFRYNHSFSLAAAYRLLETAYFLLIVLVRFLFDQNQKVHNMHPLQRLIRTMFFRWLAHIIYCINFTLKTRVDLPPLLHICAFSILHLSTCDMHPAVLSFRRMLHARRYGMFHVFPRRIRNLTPQEDDPIIIQTSLSICTTRTRRLLASPDELRREALDSMKLEYGTLSDGLYTLPPEEKSNEEWQLSLDRARSIPVTESDLTSEFLEARNNPDYDWISYKNLGCWRNHKELQRNRHRMGEYCRSNLNWDWDTSSSLKRLFRIDRPKKSSRPEGSLQQGVTGVPGAVHVGINKGTLDVSIPEKGSNLFEKIRVRYETETGEVKYKTFYAGPSAEDITSDADVGPGPRLSSAQEIDTGLLTGSLSDVGEAPRDGMRKAEVADEVHEKVWSSRKLNDASDTEDDSASIDLNDTDRPQCDRRIEEWLETQESEGL